jgi:hypothetical protein
LVTWSVCQFVINFLRDLSYIGLNSFHSRCCFLRGEGSVIINSTPVWLVYSVVGHDIPFGTCKSRGVGRGRSCKTKLTRRRRADTNEMYVFPFMILEMGDWFPFDSCWPSSSMIFVENFSTSRINLLMFSMVHGGGVICLHASSDVTRCGIEFVAFVVVVAWAHDGCRRFENFSSKGAHF